MFKLLPAALAAALLATPALASPATTGQATVNVANLNPANADDAQRLERRVERAAFAACGGHEGSVRMLKRTVTRSDCYQETLAQARADVGFGQRYAAR
ncbi:MAG: UrcA family protein [Phenylobacterium sp.]|uniref:UrcA family protein n=1 Tax=Phenylobacterium sp. TaxID=1871053 RepID=UPI0027309FA6|nr:UrcA family protein [Phenylobacterium sp.]MDP1618204.1 UrcA family protein [Phenylobacterium sp.]MDP1988936.1 UrcA family protein [Phenylobacterium sp.]MDP3384226.1 UrcA family protein [Phenylobacterium sp.]